MSVLLPGKDLRSEDPEVLPDLDERLTVPMREALQA